MKSIKLTVPADELTLSLIENGKEVSIYDVEEGIPEGMNLTVGEASTVELTIDAATGQILNWTPPTEEQMNDTFAKKVA